MQPLYHVLFSHGIFYSDSLAVSAEIMADCTLTAHTHVVPLIIQTMQNVLLSTACYFLWKLLFRHLKKKYKKIAYTDFLQKGTECLEDCKAKQSIRYIYMPNDLFKDYWFLEWC